MSLPGASSLHHEQRSIALHRRALPISSIRANVLHRSRLGGVFQEKRLTKAFKDIWLHGYSRGIPGGCARPEVGLVVASPWDAL